MKNAIRYFLLTVMMISVMGYSGECFSDEKPVLTVPAQVDLAKETKIIISGKNFTPGQEVWIIFRDVNGVLTNIGYALKPKPKADADRSWKTTWNAKRFIEKKLVKAGDYEVSVTDTEFNELASGNIKFVGKYVKP